MLVHLLVHVTSLWILSLLILFPILKILNILDIIIIGLLILLILVLITSLSSSTVFEISNKQVQTVVNATAIISVMIFSLFQYKVRTIWSLNIKYIVFLTILYKTDRVRFFANFTFKLSHFIVSDNPVPLDLWFLRYEFLKTSRMDVFYRLFAFTNINKSVIFSRFSTITVSTFLGFGRIIVLLYDSILQSFGLFFSSSFDFDNFEIDSSKFYDISQLDIITLQSN